MLKNIKITLQYLLPKRYLTQLAGWGAEWKGGWITRWIIALFIRAYKVDMKEAQKQNIADYPTFNAFFVRPLRHDARPIDPDPSVIVMPADGMISQVGLIDGEKLFQAKGYHYTLESLLAGNGSIVGDFRNGSFSIIYLAPRDYHRAHMPCHGRLHEVIYVPGELFSVNPLIAENIPHIFSRNERLICLFETPFGPMIQILVGAAIVGSIETVWLGSMTSPQEEGMIKYWSYPQTDTTDSVVLFKGQEMGRFKLGSTVINLFVSGKVFLVDHLHSHYVTRVGQRLAYGIVQDNSYFS